MHVFPAEHVKVSARSAQSPVEIHSTSSTLVPASIVVHAKAHARQARSYLNNTNRITIQETAASFGCGSFFYLMGNSFRFPAARKVLQALLMKQLIRLIPRLTRQVDAERLKGIFVNCRENNGGMRLASVQLLQLLQKLIVHLRYVL